MSNDTYNITSENLVMVLASFFKAFKSNPLNVISMDEVLSIWSDEYTLNDDGEYQILESDFKLFLNKINGIQVDRIMVALDKAGKATLAHDGNELWLIANK